MRDYRGDFEAHVTVRAETGPLLDCFQQWCQARRFKCVRIILARGEQVEQPMATWRRRATTLPLVLAGLSELGEQIVERESEYCVYDSNLALDTGWLSQQG